MNISRMFYSFESNQIEQITDADYENAQQYLNELDKLESDIDRLDQQIIESQQFVTDLSKVLGL